MQVKVKRKYFVFKEVSSADEVLEYMAMGFEYRRVAPEVVEESPRTPKPIRKRVKAVRGRKPNRRPFTQNERLEMVRLKHEGLPTRVIAHRFGASNSGAYHAIRKTCEELGVSFNGTKTDSPSRQQA